jgi:hypothetical protein
MPSSGMLRHVAVKTSMLTKLVEYFTFSKVTVSKKLGSLNVEQGLDTY